MKKFTILSCVILLAMVLIGCETMPETNSNTAVVTDETNVTVDGATTDNEIVDGDWTWDNDLTREDYDKDTAKYDKYRGEKYKDDTVGSGVNDAWLWTKTRAALATTEDLGDATINVDVENAVVTLKGTVDSEAKKKQAVEVAKGIKDVTSVTDKLVINKDDSAVDGADTEKSEMDASNKTQEMNNNR